jgi:hypothetical protein
LRKAAAEQPPPRSFHTCQRGRKRLDQGFAAKYAMAT